MLSAMNFSVQLDKETLNLADTLGRSFELRLGVEYIFLQRCDANSTKPVVSQLSANSESNSRNYELKRFLVSITESSHVARIKTPKYVVSRRVAKPSCLNSNEGARRS